MRQITKRDLDMGTLPIPNLLIRYCIPAIATIMINALYNAIDRIFVGQALGHVGIAAVTVGGTAMTLMLALSNLIGIGGSAFFSLKLGKGEMDTTAKIVNQSFLLLLILGVIEMVTGLLFLPQICRLLGVGDDAFGYAVQYLRIIFIGSVVHAVGTGMVSFLRAEGFPRAALVCSSGGAVINILLDALFIFALGWGVAGAAAATVIGQAFSAGYFLWWFAGKEQRITPLHKREMRLQKDVTAKIFAMGSSIFAMQCGVFLLQVTQQKILHWFGNSTITSDMAISALGVSTNIGGLVAQINAGFRQGIQPLFSYNYGAGLYGRVRELVWKSTLAIFCTLFICTGILFVFTEPAVTLFGSPETEELKAFYIFAVRTFNCCVPLVALNSVVCSFYQSIGAVRRANLISMMRPVFIGVSMVLLSAVVLRSVTCVFYSSALTDFISCSICGVLLIGILRQLKKEEIYAASPDYIS